MLTAERLPFEEEVRFHPTRKWRFDFTVGKRIAVEVEGGIWRGGRHQTGKGFTADIEKYNQATLDGWRVFRFTPEQVNDGYAIATIKVAWRQECLEVYTRELL